MNTTSETHMEYVGGFAGGSVTEGAGAIGTIILAIIGLAGVFDDVVAPVATIVIGAVFLMDGIMLSTANRRLISQAPRRTLGMANGVTAGVLGGLAGIVLGILALFRTAPGTRPDILVAVAVLVYGATLLVGGGAASRLISTQEVAVGAAPMSSGSLLVGLGTVVLGILAIIGLVPMTLVLVGLLSLGAGALFSGPGISTETV